MPDAELSDLERAILARIQSEFPLVSAPYGALAADLGETPEAVYAGVTGLRRRGIVRRIGGSFAAGRLGYVSTLVGVRVDQDALAAVAACAGAHAEVTHNYEREGEVNLWFTVIAPSRERLEAILASVRSEPGVHCLYELPARRLFKIRVDFRFGEAVGAATGPSSGALAQCSFPLVLDAADRRLIRCACGDLDGSREPFGAMAAEAGLSEAEVLRRLSGYRDAGAMRRFGAILRHRAAGFGANGMSIWNVPDAEVERVGEALAARPEVSHCYERPRLPGWPYNVFGMIHARSREDCLSVASAVSSDTGVKDMRVLFSGREFKKSSMVYFADAEPAAPRGR